MAPQVSVADMIALRPTQILGQVHQAACTTKTRLLVTLRIRAKPIRLRIPILLMVTYVRVVE